jgi:hypothetical protein
VTPDHKYEFFYYSTFYLLIKTYKFTLVNFFQNCLVWEIFSLDKNSKSRKKCKSEKLAFSNCCRK